MPHFPVPAEGFIGNRVDDLIDVKVHATTPAHVQRQVDHVFRAVEQDIVNGDLVLPPHDDPKHQVAEYLNEVVSREVSTKLKRAEGRLKVDTQTIVAMIQAVNATDNMELIQQFQDILDNRVNELNGDTDTITVDAEPEAEPTQQEKKVWTMDRFRETKFGRGVISALTTIGFTISTDELNLLTESELEKVS